MFLFKGQKTAEEAALRVMQRRKGEAADSVGNGAGAQQVSDDNDNENLAAAILILGEFHDILSKVSPDVLRILAAGFMDESTDTKTQILNLAIKLALRLPDDENVQSLMQYVLEMSRYDTDTDLRDRSRFMTGK